MKRFVHLGVNPVGAVAARAGTGWPPGFNLALQAYLTQLGCDWYRYAAQNYVIWTDLNLDEVAQGIAALPGFQFVYVLLTEFTPAQCSGWMPQPFWSWLARPR